MTAKQVIQSVTDDYGIVDCDECPGLCESWASVVFELGNIRRDLDGPTELVARIINFVLEGCNDGRDYE